MERKRTIDRSSAYPYSYAAGSFNFFREISGNELPPSSDAADYGGQAAGSLHLRVKFRAISSAG